MPAEKIQTASQHPNDNPADRPHLRVSWGHEHNSVQVASLFNPQHGADVILNVVNEWLKAAGLDQIPGREELNKRITDKADPETAQAWPVAAIGFDGFWVTLDERRDVNHLISVARKARDQAFGVDA